MSVDFAQAGHEFRLTFYKQWKSVGWLCIRRSRVSVDFAQVVEEFRLILHRRTRVSVDFAYVGQGCRLTLHNMRRVSVDFVRAGEHEMTAQAGESFGLPLHK